MKTASKPEADAGRAIAGQGGVSADGGSVEASPRKLAELAGLLAVAMDESIAEIHWINQQTRVLSLNAQVEAARAGDSGGAAFGVVARAMGDLSETTAAVADTMAKQVRRAVAELESISRELGTTVRGLRFSDLALTNIDLIDRNLYERSCDVRWWATDASLVIACTDLGPPALGEASRRMGIILDSYTVYYDLVLCDMHGKVVANGRPGSYHSVGRDVGGAAWYRSAVATRSGAEFGFEGVHASPLVDGRKALVYSCCVRADGDQAGRPIGVLGIVFNWENLTRTIIAGTPLSPAERRTGRVCIVDDAGLLLADSRGRELVDAIDFPDRRSVFLQDKNFVILEHENRRCCIAHARSPGYETYATGWHSLIIVPVED